METMETMVNGNVYAWSVQSIIDAVHKIAGPAWKHNMNDVYGRVQHPAIEELRYLHFKLDGNLKIQPSKEENDQMLSKIRQLGIGRVEIHTSIGRFLVIELTNRILVDEYNSFEQFVKTNEEKINQMYESVNKQVPKEFIAYRLWFKT